MNVQATAGQIPSNGEGGLAILFPDGRTLPLTEAEEIVIRGLWDAQSQVGELKVEASEFMEAIREALAPIIAQSRNESPCPG